MPKLQEAQLQKMKAAQDFDDDDMELDITKRKRLHQKREDKSTDEEPEKDSSKDTRNLLILIGSIALIFLIFVGLRFIFTPEKHELTIEDLHKANLEGKLLPEQGYMYHGYSFVNYAGIWHSQVQKGNTMYDITFNYDPKSVENITVEGKLQRFSQTQVYITFDTNATAPKYITVANAGLSMSLAKGFQYNLTATCTNNESSVCQNNGVVTCDDKDKPVIYFKESNETKIVLEDNCVTIQGYGPDLVRAKDRLLLRWYGILD